MDASAFLVFCIHTALVVIALSYALILIRLARGSSACDRILALDLLTILTIGFLVVVAIQSRVYSYLDVAIALGLVGFLATVAFARFVLQRWISLRAEQEKENQEQQQQEPSDA